MPSSGPDAESSVNVAHRKSSLRSDAGRRSGLSETWIIASPPYGRTRADDPVSVRPDHRPVSLIAEDFEEHGVGDAAVDDVDGVDAAARGFEGRGDLGQHAA